MAAKFAKEEEISYSESNSDATSDAEYNNSKSRSSSPSGALEERIYNDCSRSGGPCAPQVWRCKHCDIHCEGVRVVVFICKDRIYLCQYCFENDFFTCPKDRMSPRKHWYYPS